MSSISELDKAKLELFEHFWQYSDDNIFLASLDDDGDFIVENMNPSQMQNLGQDEAVLNKKLKDFLGEENACYLQDKYLKCLQENKVIVEEDLINLNGKEKCFYTTIIPIHDEKDKKKIIGISREITELKHTKKDLEELTSKLNLLLNKESFDIDLNNKLDTLAFEDSLTGAGNRRYLSDHANKAISLAHRYNSCLALLIVDIDDLTLINKNYSHSFGDTVLKKVSNLIKKSIRDSDIFVRYSGDQFLILLPMTSLDASQILGKRLLDESRALEFEFNNKKVSISVSIATAQLESPHDNLDSLLQKTYSALSFAKENGKNKLVSFMDKDLFKTKT